MRVVSRGGAGLGLRCRCQTKIGTVRTVSGVWVLSPALLLHRTEP